MFSISGVFDVFSVNAGFFRFYSFYSQIFAYASKFLMRNYVFNKGFHIGFWMALVSVILFNLLTFFVPAESRFRHVVNGVGFPLPFYEWGGDPYFERFSIIGIFADVSVGLIYSFLVGTLFGFLWRREILQNRS